MTTLAILADTHHYRKDDDLYILSPVAAQIERIGALFDDVVTCAPLFDGAPPANFEPYLHGRVRLHALTPAGGASLGAKMRLVATALSWPLRLRRTAKEADFVHLRCPCNVTLAALLTVPARIPWYAIYAGPWDGYSAEPWSFRLQRWLLRRRRNGIVTVYSSAATHPPNIVPFFSPIHTEAELTVEARAAQPKIRELLDGRRPAPFRAVCVGQLSANKNQETAIRAVGLARRRGVDVELDVVGQGPLADRLHAVVQELGLSGVVRLRGLLPRSQVEALNRRAHVSMLLSKAEGYGKTVLEGMAAGAVPVLSRYPLAFEFSGDGRRGVTVDGSDSDAVAEILAALAHEPVRLGRMAQACLAYAKEHSLDAFGERLASLFRERWPEVFGDQTVPGARR